MELKVANSNLKLTHYNVKSNYQAKTKKAAMDIEDKKLWQTVILIIISVVTIVAFFTLPWIILSEDMKINILQFSVSLNGIIDFVSSFKDSINNLSITGININDSIDAMKLFRTINYVAYAIPAANIILIIITIFTRKMRTLINFILFIDLTCIVISILEIILFNYLQFDYKVIIFSIYDNFHTDPYHMEMSITGFVNTLLTIFSQSQIIRVDTLTAIISSSSFMTIVLSSISILVASVFYFISKINKNAKQPEEENNFLENI